MIDILSSKLVGLYGSPIEVFLDGGEGHSFV